MGAGCGCASIGLPVAVLMCRKLPSSSVGGPLSAVHCPSHHQPEVVQCTGGGGGGGGAACAHARWKCALTSSRLSLATATVSVHVAFTVESLSLGVHFCVTMLHEPGSVSPAAFFTSTPCTYAPE